MPEPFTVLCDIDGVVADLLPRWLELYRKDTGHEFYPRHVTQWDLSNLTPMGVGIYDYLRRPDLYEGVKPIPGALDGVNTLRSAGCRVVFVTAAGRDHAGTKLEWLANHGFLELLYGSSKDYVVACDKSLVAGDALIDDFTGNNPTILFDPAGWHPTWESRAENWSEVVETVTRHISWSRQIEEILHQCRKQGGLKWP